jgi:hypothetical protein
LQPRLHSRLYLAHVFFVHFATDVIFARSDGEKVIALFDQFTIDRLDIGEKSIDWRTDLGALHLGLELFARFLESIEITIAVDSLRLNGAPQSICFALRLLVFDCWHIP